MTKKLESLIKKWNDSGRVSNIQKRKKIVCLNGFKYLTYKEADIYLTDFFCN